jgi:tetratricopeptide (TPR) repeat protein
MSADRLDKPRTQLRPPSDFRLPPDTGDVLSQRLRRVHERVAQTTERRMPAAIAEIAMHYDQGGSSEKAYQYALMAADQARVVYAHQESLELLEIAERNAGSDASLADVRLRMAQVAEAMGQFEQAEALCDSVIEWMTAHADPRRTIAPRRIRERIRNLLGQPARRTLAICMALDEEAADRGLDAERVALLNMISQAHSRLGERTAAERTALEGVKLGERLGDATLLADNLVRLGVTREPVDADESVGLYRRALELYRTIGDYRGMARCHNNLGISHQLRGEWSNAQDELDRAIAAARSAGMREVWGLAALNAGVMALKRAEYDRAGDRFGEAMAIFGAMKNTERELYSVYNLAHLERERGDHDAATELYDVAGALARSIGQSDIEIGARAGYGLSLLEQGKDVAARVASLESAERLRGRTEWFQGRELAEALRVRILAADGKAADARRRLDEALTLATDTDWYGAAWLTACCAPAMLSGDAEYVRGVVGRYAPSAKKIGYTAITTRLDGVSAR